jgi:hypothetical protein
MICKENDYLDEFIIGRKTWWVCSPCVKYGVIMLINKRGGVKRKVVE